jgi:hypothetical protein
MAKVFLTNINLKGNQLLNAVIHSASQAPTALAAGQLYYNTGDNTFYYSTAAGNSSWSPVGVQYISSVGTNLSVSGGGQLTISSNPVFESIELTRNGAGTNIKVGDDAYIGDVNVPNHIAIIGQEDATAGGIVFGDAKTEAIDSNGHDLTLTSANDIILLPGSDYAYIGEPAVDGHNRIATLADVSQGAIQTVEGTTDQIAVSKTGETVTISLPSYINVPNGELHLKKTEYWTGDNDVQYGIIAANTYSNAFSISSVGYPLQLESHTGDIQMLPDSGIVTIGTGYGELHLQKTEYWRDGTQQGIIAAQSDGSLRLTGVNNSLQLESNNGNVNITSYNNDIQLNADGQVIVSSGTNLVVGNNIYVKNGIYAGGQDTATDGVIRIQDYNGNNLFTVTADGNNNGGSATVDVKGTINVYRPGATGPQVGQFIGDSSNNLIINAIDNNLILQSDNSNSVYIGSVADDNKVVKFSDLTAVQSGLTWKEAVNLLWNDSNAVLTGATGSLEIDGHPALGTAQAGYRILITSGANAGIWSYADDGTNWTLTRTADAATYQELIGAAVFVMEGTNYGSTSWVQSNHYLTNFTGQSWSQFSGQGTYTGSSSIGLDGNAFYLKLDSDSLAITGSGVKVNYHTDGGLDNDGGLYVKTAGGVQIDGDGNVAINYTTLESQLVTDGFAKTSDYTGVTRKYAANITGNGTDYSFPITHGLATRDIQVRVYQTSMGPDTQYADVEVDVVRASGSDLNNVSIVFASAPALNVVYRVVVIG